MAIQARVCVLLSILGLLAACQVAAASTGGWVGSRAPEYSVDEVLEPRGATVSREEMQGRTVVMVFWSTDCPTCPDVLPHINRLTERFADDSVIFLSVLNEKEEVVREFLETKIAVNTWIALDHDLSMTQDYFIPGVPIAIVVNANGVVAARTHPLNLSERVIRDAVNGRTPSARLFGWPEQLLFKEDPKQPPVYELSMRPADPKAERSFTRVAGLRLRGVQLREILSLAYNMNQHELVSDSLLLDAKFDITVVPPAGRENEVREMLKDLLRQTMGITAHLETRELKVYEAHVPNEPGRSMRPAAANRREWDYQPGVYTGSNVSPIEILYYIFLTLDTPVFDETGLEGAYDFRLTWNAAEPESIITAMRRQLGIELRETTREMEVLVVELE